MDKTLKKTLVYVNLFGSIASNFFLTQLLCLCSSTPIPVTVSIPSSSAISPPKTLQLKIQGG